MHIIKNIRSKRIIKCIFFLLAFYYISSHYIPKLIIQPKHHIFQSIKYLKHKEKSNNYYINTTFTSEEGMNIKGVFSPSNTNIKNKGTLILIHGIRGDLSYFKTLTPQLNREGYNTFALDLRGHGNSEGKYCTFGAKEKYDIKSAIDHLKNQFGISDHIGVWGQSLGGSVALQAMALDTRIRFGVIESTFSSYETITQAYFKRLFKINMPEVVNFLTKRATKLADFELNEANTTLACSNITQPVFIAHGDLDIHIPLNNGLMNYNSLKSEYKVFKTIEGATHVNLWAVGGESYFKEVIRFIESVE